LAALPRFWVGFYTGEPEVAALAASLLMLGALFQVFDGVQVVLTGAMRGLKETKIPLLMNLAGFTFIGLPVGYYATFHADAGPQGLWFGLVTGLISVAVLLFWAWRLRTAGYRTISKSST